MRWAAAMPAAVALAATPAAAQLRVLPDAPPSAEAGRDGVAVYLVNEGTDAWAGMPPATIAVTAADGTRLALVPAGEDEGALTIAPGGFARLRYRQREARAAALAIGSREAASAGANGGAASFRERLMPYEPTYGVAGAGDAGAKLQMSLLLAPIAGGGFASRFRFGYTQTMFWAIDRPSGPVRATIYSPEVFFDLPVAPMLSAAFGYRHDSNGRGDARSIDVNRLYAGVAARYPLGDGWELELVPRAWFYVGPTNARGAIADAWGYGSLRATVGRANGLKLSVLARGNPATERGGAELFASYPLAHAPGGLGIYAFGEGYAGHGETLEEALKRDAHLRLGIALTR